MFYHHLKISPTQRLPRSVSAPSQRKAFTRGSPTVRLGCTAPAGGKIWHKSESSFKPGSASTSRITQVCHIPACLFFCIRTNDASVGLRHQAGRLCTRPALWAARPWSRSCSMPEPKSMLSPATSPHCTTLCSPVTTR